MTDTMAEDKYIEQYNEVKANYEGKSAEEIRTAFGKDITNDDGEYIDTNYKDILVTFNIVDGKAVLSHCFEMYNEEGVFLDTCYIPRNTTEIATEIVKEYFGGYMPKSLADEGMKCEDDNALYHLIENIEVYYMNEYPTADFGNDVDEIHSIITTIVRKLNQMK